MKDDVKLKQHLSGQTLILSGGVTRKKLKALDEASFDCIVIDGEEEFSLDYLKDFKHKIFKLGANKIAPADISFLSELQSLTLHHAKGSFPNFQCLRQLNLMTSTAWHPSVSQLDGLEYLEVHGWPEKDLHSLANMKNLIRLSLVDSRRIECLEGLSTLNTLGLTGCPKLVDCSHLGRVQDLQGLYIESCKAIQDFAFLAQLNQLVELYLNVPRLPSLSVLAKLPELKSLCFANTLIEDLDVAIQTEFPTLRLSAFRKKRGYNQTSEAIDEVLSTRWHLPPDPWSKKRETIIGYSQPRFSLSPIP